MVKDGSLQGLVVGMERDLLTFEGTDITDNRIIDRIEP